LKCRLRQKIRSGENLGQKVRNRTVYTEESQPHIVGHKHPVWVAVLACAFHRVLGRSTYGSLKNYHHGTMCRIHCPQPSVGPFERRLLMAADYAITRERALESFRGPPTRLPDPSCNLCTDKIRGIREDEDGEAFYCLCVTNPPRLRS